MPKKRSPSSRKYAQIKNKERIRFRPSRGRSHVHRKNHRPLEFEALRKELTKTLGLPSDCRIYFLNRYEMDNLPTKDRLQIKYQNSVLLDAHTWKVLLVVRFTTFREMDEEKMKEMKFVVKTIYNHTTARPLVTVNAAMQGLKDPGEMYSAGFRCGSEKGRKFGVTAISTKTSKSELSIAEDQARMRVMGCVNNTLAEWFSTLSLQAFKSNHDLALKFSIPSFSDPSWVESPNANVIASNIICTRDGFNNKAHKDLDETAYSYGLFAKIERATGELHWDEMSDYLGDIVGCHFILDEYHVELLLDSCDGVIEICWASNEFHHTSPSTTYNEGWTPIHPKNSFITRFGSSLQISSALVKRIDGLLKLKDGKTDEQWEKYKKEVVKCYSQEIESKLGKIQACKFLLNESGSS